MILKELFKPIWELILMLYRTIADIGSMMLFMAVAIVTLLFSPLILLGVFIINIIKAVKNERKK